MRKILILKGLPASGKTTYAKQLIEDNPGHWARISKDDLRAMLHNGHHSKYNENFILGVRNTLIKMILRDTNRNVIIDDTNLNPVHEKQIRDLVTEINAVSSTFQIQVEVQDFFLNTVSLEECLQRDAKRENPVGEKVIIDMYNRWLKPKEHFDIRHDYVKYNPELSDAIIVDLDGTLAIHNGRNPYEGEKCESDKLNISVAKVIDMFYKTDVEILLVSGRTERAREATKAWLLNHDIIWSRLYMRPDGDGRKDSIVKEEIYNNHIKDKYNVLLVLDDRNQTVAKWRELKLPTWQVAEGNF